MDSEKQHLKDEGEVVYRRLPTPEEERARGAGGVGGRVPGEMGFAMRLAPTLTPLVVGFVVLLSLVFVLGNYSLNKLEGVSSRVLDLEQRHAAKLSLLLQLRVALTRLDNEARARAESEARRELRPPFELRLRNARSELNALLPRFDNPELIKIPSWRAMRDDLATYLGNTQDLAIYSQSGFESFSKVDDELNAILKEVTVNEQEQILQESERTQQEAARSIRYWRLLTLLIGALVAAGTIWEVQRRFRQIRQGIRDLGRERQFSAQMLEGMVSAVTAIDAHGHIRSANAAFFKLFPKATLGASVHNPIASPDAMRMLEAAISSRVTEATYRGRWESNVDDVARANRSFDVYSSPLALDGEQGQIITLVDVTEAAEAETTLRRTESLRAVGQASAQVAHEIKNPLGSIRLGVSMLRDTAHDAESRNIIDLVERGINHLDKLVVDVTQFSRQQPPQRADVELQEILNVSLELVRDRIQEKGTPIEKRFSEEALHGSWDEDQLRQVFVNLLANAIDASPTQAPITISTERVVVESGSGDHQPAGTRQRRARITIADQGTGMDEETRARLFEPFFTTKKRGTGLGLAISKQIVEQHGGTITVSSEQGTGTRFIVDLPLAMNG
jgi:signal transduction histidine kinase